MSNYSVYVLQLSGNRYYVGIAQDVETRVAKHFTGKGARWTQLHPPIRLLDSRPILREHPRKIERIVTLMYMRKFGIDRVRGSNYTRTQLTASDLKEINRRMSQLPQ